MVAALATADLAFPVLRVEEATVEPTLSPDAALSRAAARRDKGAFARLVEAHKRAVYGLCVRLLADPEEARDAAQEAFVRAYASIAGYDPRQPFGPWVLRIARNHCLDQLRRRVPARRRVELDADPPDGAERRELPDAETPPADVALERAEVAVRLEAAVRRLPPNHREVIQLFHVEQMSYKEIASAMEVPIGTVMTWLHRARARLREALSAGEARP